MSDRTKRLTVENAEILYSNFSGMERQNNPAGNRNFCLVVPTDIVEELKADGWNVKPKKMRDPDDDPVYFIQVAIGFNNPKYPVRIVVSTENGENQMSLDESTINCLDWAEIVEVKKVVVNPRVWINAMGEEKIKAYLRTLKVVIDDEDYEEIAEGGAGLDEDDVPF